MTVSQAPKNGKEINRLAFALRALKSRNYRLFFAGQLVSLVGTWLTNIATGWLVYQLTGSTVPLGEAAFAGQVPAFFVAPFAGVLVDRWPLRRVLVITQTLSMLQSATLAVLTLTRVITFQWIVLLLAFQGLVNAFDIPARQAFVVQMIDDRDDLPNAIALNSSMFNAARLLGPAAGGILIWLFGSGICFSIDAVSYAAVIVALLMMVITWQPAKRARKHVLHELREGLVYVIGFMPVRVILMLLAAVSLLGIPYMTLMPAFAKDVLRGGPQTYGFLSASAGAGALVGAVLLAMRRSVVGLERSIGMAVMGFGCVLLAFSFSRSLPLSMLLLACAGFCQITQMAAGNTVLQTLVDDQKRGRVMAFFMMSFMGMMPLGSLIYGFLARPEILGAPGTVRAGGVMVLVAGAVFLTQLPRIGKFARPVYEGMGILPPVAVGLQTDAAVAQAEGE